MVVGGGAAGIGAARRLAKAGRNALLLEAAPRIGGRAWTHDIRGLPIDLGCGWLHSAGRNAWMNVAHEAGIPIDQNPPAWGKQFRNLGFTPAEQVVAREAFDSWTQRMTSTPPRTDCAADALERGNEWNPYIRAIAGFISGATLEQLSVADYVAYDENSTDDNWRLHSGYGTLIAGALPETVLTRLSTPVDSIALTAKGVTLATPAGDIRARAAIITVSTHVLAAGGIKLPRELDAWREAASQLPLGRNEKLYFEIEGSNAFEAETQVFGSPREARTGAYYIRPFGWPILECFLGGEGAHLVEQEGPAAGFAFAFQQLGSLFGAEACRALKPLIASSWSRADRIGGAYSYALPGYAKARAQLARPFEKKLFFAGEATNALDYSTAHGAHDSGVRAANELIATS